MLIRLRLVELPLHAGNSRLLVVAVGLIGVGFDRIFDFAPPVSVGLEVDFEGDAGVVREARGAPDVRRGAC